MRMKVCRDGAAGGGSLAVLWPTLAAGAAQARPPLSDDQVRQKIIQESIASYKATGHPCACPFAESPFGKSRVSISAQEIAAHGDEDHRFRHVDPAFVIADERRQRVIQPKVRSTTQRRG